MSIQKKWSHYTKENVKKEPDNFGVYQLSNKEQGILYIGEGHIRTRLLAHFPNASEPVVGASLYRYELTGSKKRCVQRQNSLLIDYRNSHNKKNPPFNSRSKN